MTEEKQQTQAEPADEAAQASAQPAAQPSAAPEPGAEAPAPAAAKKKRTTRIVIAVVAVLVVVAAAFGIWQLASGGMDSFFDSNAMEGQAPYKTPEEMQAELDRIVEEGMFNISIASVIQFDNGTAPGKAYIENVPGNRYLMQVTITLDTDDPAQAGDVVYETKAIKPGHFIEDITLTKDLDQGTYPATATFTALDAETHEEAGKAAAKVTLNVMG